MSNIQFLREAGPGLEAQRRSHRPRSWLFCLLGLGFVTGVCCDEVTSNFSAQIGVVQGRVLGGGQPVEVPVTAYRAESTHSVQATTRTNANGEYRLELPFGNYDIQARGDFRAGVGVSDVEVNSTEQTLDLLGGQVTFRVAMPAKLEGMNLLLTVESADGFQDSHSNTVSEGDIELHIPFAAPGEYRLSLGRISSSWNATYYFPGTHDFNEADTFTVGNVFPATYDLELTTYASLAGSVTGSWQQLSVGSPVVLALTADSTVVVQEQPRPDGTFLAHLLLAQPVRLLVRHRGIDQWIGGNSFQTARIFDLQGGQHVTGIDHIESGLICNLLGPGFISDVQADVLLQDESGRNYEPSYGFQNPIRLANLLPGRYFLHVRKRSVSNERWLDQWFDAADSFENATPIDLIPGTVAVVNVQLIEGASLVGRVLSPLGQATDASITLYDASKLPIRHWFQRTFDTSFAFNGLDNGIYYLAAATTLHPWWYPGSYIPDAAEPIVVQNLQSRTGLEWRLPTQTQAGVP